MSSATAPPSHVTESISDRKKSRELAEARQNGAVAPAVDVKTGAMINPHNPDFITKRPWYLGNNDDGPSLDHQVDPSSKELLLSMQSADIVLKQERQRLQQKQHDKKFEVGMWVEALKKSNKGPYRICQITKIAKKGTQFDLKFEDGTVELKVKYKAKSSKGNSGIFNKPRIRMTKTGSRSLRVDESKYGKETYDSKRDKFHGYDQETHTQKVSKVFAERDEIRKQSRDKTATSKDGKTGDGNDDKKKSKHDRGSDSDDSDVDDSDIGSEDDSDDEFVQRDEDDRIITTRLARQGGVGGAQMKVTARNLRIREDTAKYLRNLDPSSAFYDPKSRSMRDNPNPEVAAEESQFAGDNFARISGDAVQLADAHLFAWDAAEQGAGAELHPQANPSQVEMLKKKFQSKSAQLQLQKKKKVLDKYGGHEYLDGSGGLANAILPTKPIKGAQNRTTTAAEERKIRFGVSTISEEYSRDGRQLKGASKQPKQVAQASKYQEDIYINGHTSVWGSFFHIGAFQWGYLDDHSVIRNSYCTGDAGRQANDEANEMRFGTGVAGSAALAQARGMLKVMPKPKSNNGSSNTFEPPSSRSKFYGEANPNAEVDPGKVKKALEKMNKEDSSRDERKRKYNSVNAEDDVTEEEMEAYRLRKERNADPMAKISSEELLDYK
jgi:pre-mRNA-processing factor SLU7